MLMLGDDALPKLHLGVWMLFLFSVWWREGEINTKTRNSMESRNVQKMELQECQCWEITPLPNYTEECGCSTVQLSNKGREGKGNKLNGVKTCPKDWSVLLLLVQLKGLQGCKCWGKWHLCHRKGGHNSGVLICGKLEAKKWVSPKWGLQKGKCDQVLEEWKCRIDVQGGSWKAIVRGTLKKGAMEVEDQPWTPRRWKKGPKTCRYSQETKRKRIYTEAFWERGRRNEKQQNNERRKGNHNSILFLVSLSVPRITPRSLPFPTTHLLVAPFC